MRPSLLVIIMDFLVSSLLLYVTGTGEWLVGQSVTVKSAEPAAVMTTPDFSPAGLADMEMQWLREYQEQLKDLKLTSQADQLADMSVKNRDLILEKSGLSTRLTVQELDLARKRSETEKLGHELSSLAEQRAKMEDALRKKQTEADALTTAKARLETMTTNLVEDLETLKDRLEKEKAEAAERQNEMQEQNKKLRMNIAAQVETIHRQNEILASQQQTITQTLQNVVDSQGRIENKTGEIQQSQEQTQATLKNFQVFLARLPDELKENAKNVAEEQARLSAVIGSLVNVASNADKTVATDGQQQLIVGKLDALAEMQKGLEKNLSALMKNADTRGIAKDLTAVRRQQEDMKDNLSGMVNKMDVMEARQTGPFSALRDARIEVRGYMETGPVHDGNKTDGGKDRKKTSVFAPLIASVERPVLAVHAHDLGLKWNGISRHLETVRFSIIINSNEAPVKIKGPLHALTAEPRLLIIDSQTDPAIPSVLARDNAPKPMKLVGRAGLEKRGSKDIYLFKRNLSGIAFMIEMAPDMANADYLIVRRTFSPLMNKLIRTLMINPDNRAEAGDYLVTAEGDIVGLMVDDQKCFVLSAENITQYSRDIPLQDLDGFVKGVKELHKDWK